LRATLPWKEIIADVEDVITDPDAYLPKQEVLEYLQRIPEYKRVIWEEAAWDLELNGRPYMSKEGRTWVSGDDYVYHHDEERLERKLFGIHIR